MRSQYRDLHIETCGKNVSWQSWLDQLIAIQFTTRMLYPKKNTFHLESANIPEHPLKSRKKGHESRHLLLRCRAVRPKIRTQKPAAKMRLDDLDKANRGGEGEEGISVGSIPKM